MKKESLSEKKKKQTDANEGKTVFVRNIAYDTSGEDVKEFFGKYGKVEDVKMVR